MAAPFDYHAARLELTQRDLKDQADRLDFELSRVTFSIPEAVARLQELDALPAPTMA